MSVLTAGSNSCCKTKYCIWKRDSLIKANDCADFLPRGCRLYCLITNINFIMFNCGKVNELLNSWSGKFVLYMKIILEISLCSVKVCFCSVCIQAYLRQLKMDLRLYKECLRLSNRLSCRWGRRGGSHTIVKEKIKQHNNNNNLVVLYISLASSPVDI